MRLFRHNGVTKSPFSRALHNIYSQRRWLGGWKT
uniref:Uncharacterized protein n=1 Tax=Siphoviridae sp. ctX581 TaxID=2826365 RepID=A0A8S5MDG1_9CAUD|nr:MAG TPA: hypothetical protein [Siphoviridae sp. ctX581]